MKPRLDYSSVAPDALKPLFAAGAYLRKSGTIEPELLHLIDMRASQINGCAFCLAMHWREAKEAGTSDERLHGLAGWRESSFYSPRERAALAWTEALTTEIVRTRVPDDVYAEAAAHFSERELVDLTLAVTTINAWNRFNIAFHTPPERAEAVLKMLARA
jgi:AhpD family alkylhydroperoxidase